MVIFIILPLHRITVVIIWANVHKILGLALGTYEHLIQVTIVLVLSLLKITNTFRKSCSWLLSLEGSDIIHLIFLVFMITGATSLPWSWPLYLYLLTFKFYWSREFSSPKGKMCWFCCCFVLVFSWQETIVSK